MLSYMLMDDKQSVPNKDLLHLEITNSDHVQHVSPNNHHRTALNGNKNVLLKKLNNNTLIHHQNKKNTTSMLIQQQQQQQQPQSGTISKESSVSSCLSDATTASCMTPTSTISSTCDYKPKAKILTNTSVSGTKHTTLKRVSFGSSKGSMVETLIYESPLQEEPENSPIIERPCPNFPTTLTHSSQDSTDSTELERSKVRVSFFQQSRPQQISPVNSTENLLHLDISLPIMAAAVQQPTGPLSATATITDINGTLQQYSRQESTDSGWDNPFRPGGELDREAEELIDLIKGGKPITPTPDSAPLPEDEHTIHSGGTSPTATPASTATSPMTQSPKKMNLATVAASPPPKPENGSKPGNVDIKRDTMNSPGEAEHVVLKKKPKCKCCVIQ